MNAVTFLLWPAGSSAVFQGKADKHWMASVNEISTEIFFGMDLHTEMYRFDETLECFNSNIENYLDNEITTYDIEINPEYDL